MGWGGRRPGAGRKPTFNDHVDRTVRFERTDLEALEALAAERGASVGELIREAVSRYLARVRRK
jgi:hypothetical protein